jgi:hypothetical protein
MQSAGSSPDTDFGEVRRHEAHLVYLDLLYAKKQPNQKKHQVNIIPNNKLERYCLHAKMTLPFEIEDTQQTIIVDSTKKSTSKDKEPVIEMRETNSVIIPVGTHENLTWERYVIHLQKIIYNLFIRLASFCEEITDPCLAVVDSDGTVSYYKFNLANVQPKI